MNCVSLHPTPLQCDIAAAPIKWWGLPLYPLESGLHLCFALTNRMW